MQLHHGYIHPAVEVSVGRSILLLLNAVSVLALHHPADAILANFLRALVVAMLVHHAVRAHTRGVGVRR
jgi:hypothetical protein